MEFRGKCLLIQSVLFVFIAMCCLVGGGLLSDNHACAQDNGLSGDLDHNGFVNAHDQLILMDQWHMGVPPMDTGMNAVVRSVVIPVDNRPEITFALTDSSGNPISATKEGLTVRWILSRIVEDNIGQNRTHYESYSTRSVSNQVGYEPPGTVNAKQANFATGNFSDPGNGDWMFKFTSAIVGFNPALTHTVGAQIEMRDPVSRAHLVAPQNPLYTFRPDGGQVTTVREISSTVTCNKCHTRMELHGGGRREYGLCVLCHNPAPDNIDPDSGNPIDMAAMIHKIHSGANLPSVEDGTPYIIYGNNNSEHDYSHVEFPQDTRNCQTCHTLSTAKLGPEAWNTVPSRRACGSCHDDVNFETGVGHGDDNLPMNSDVSCAGCHPPTGDVAYGESVADAHQIPWKEDDFPKWHSEILDVADVAAGATPTVTFSLYQEVGGVTSVVDLADVNRLRVVFAGPTEGDYVQEFSNTINTGALVDMGGGTYTQQLSRAIPADAVGTYAFALESRGNGLPDFEDARPSVQNPVVFKAVTGSLAPRREAIDFDKCLACHDRLSLHGDQRNQYQYCVMCHRPNASDIAQVPEDATTGLPIASPTTIDFKTMIHKIHTGEELENPYTVYGFGSTPYDFTEGLFPGRREECEICHLPGTYGVPAPDGAADTVIEDASGNEILRMGPSTSACTACHDSDSALAHATSFVGLAGGAENCASCHGQAGDEAFDRVHRLGL
jgi:OmcA/MtrC family decaheme c-type cytochrome